LWKAGPGPARNKTKKRLNVHYLSGKIKIKREPGKLGES
jgi:hypothetical protein